ncbi:7728_t:CDS:1 [Acaulospora colombiana]|uniref:7728_t:CDS:1 n=1 Tax=Acaulospora colombiana TaxID=27376 RepID=A0ACA9MZG5_9GLOM|nr:7728_t:CDS:1 [Acaulospora colombiana]
MKKLSQPFRKLSETVVPEMENRKNEHEIEKLQKLIQNGNSLCRNSSIELTIQEFYKIVKERNIAQKKIECLNNNESYIEPVEGEIQELSFCAKISKNQVPHADLKNDLRNRYSTFLYTPDECDEGESNVGLGEKYTSYQLDKNVFRRKRKDLGFLRHTELIGAYHEDYERILVFASSLIGETINRVQEAVRKVELDLYESIEKENL